MGQTQDKQAVLYRMVMDGHVCPYGLKARHLLRRAGYTVDDRWLRSRDEVANAQIREFVAGELRLHLDLTSGLEMTAFKQWLGEHAGDIVTSTDKVLEIRFTDAA